MRLHRGQRLGAWPVVAVLSFAILGLGVAVTGPSVRDAEARTPAPAHRDVVLIVTDDQALGTMRHMPFTARFFRTHFVDAYVSNPLCCPSRTSILTGTYSSTNGVWTNDPPYGGWPVFAAGGWEEHSIASALQTSGYRTGLIGKFLNSWDDRLPTGWDVIAAHANQGLHGPDSPYFDYSLLREDGTYEPHGHDAADYSTDVLADHARSFIATSDTDEPLFLYLAFNAPHSSSGGRPPVPAPRHRHEPLHLSPLAPDFLEADVDDKPAYLRRAIRRREEAPFYVLWRNEAALSLLAVDEAIESVVEAQEVRDPGLDDTLFLLISDNGHLTGAHNWHGKAVPYEEAIRVPLLMRAPGIQGGDVRQIVGNVDIAPTILEWADAYPTWTVDGTSLFHPSGRDWMLIQGAAPGHPFCGIANDSMKLVRYASGEWEFYDLDRDPYELKNRDGRPSADLLAKATAACDGRLPPEWPRHHL